MAEPELPDQEQRDLIESRLDVNLLVEAGAGSGKTESLVRRMVAGIAAGVYDVDGMAAVTFTRKAAAELRGRFQLALEKRLAGEQAQPRLQHALDHMEQLFAGTIHSFCARLLRERPVEAGIAPGFVELDEAADAEQRAEAWRAYIARETASGSPALAALARAEVRPADLEDAFARVCLHAEVDFPAGTVEPPDTAAAWAALERFADRLRKLLPSSIPEETSCRVQQAARTLLRRLPVADRTRPPVLARLLSEWDHGFTVVQKRWADTPAEKKRMRDTVNPLVAEFRRDVVVPFLSQWKQHVYRQAMTVLIGARDFAEEERRRVRGEMFLLVAREDEEVAEAPRALVNAGADVAGDRCSFGPEGVRRVRGNGERVHPCRRRILLHGLQREECRLLRRRDGRELALKDAVRPRAEPGRRAHRRR